MKFLLALMLGLSSLSAFAFELEPTRVYKNRNIIFVEYKNEFKSSIECKVYYKVETTKGEITDSTGGRYLFSGDEAKTWLRVDKYTEGYIKDFDVSIRCKWKKLY